MYRREGGFTIVETMIVLAVTGLIFVGSVGMFSSRRGPEQFNQDIRDADSKIQDIFGNVSNGYSSGLTKITCKESGANLSFTNGGTGDDLGKNDHCIFIGKAVGFKPDSSDFTTYTVVGHTFAQGASDRDTSQTISEALPVIVPDLSDIKLTEIFTLNNGTTVKSVKAVDSSGTVNSGRFLSAFYKNIGNTAAGDVAGTVKTYAFPIGDGSIIGDADTCIRATTAPCSSPDNYAFTQLQVCFDSATSNQTAVININNINGTVSTFVEFKACS